MTGNGYSDLPCSPASERNKQPILEVLQAWLPDAAGVLEIGSGTGQHAVHFQQHMPGLRWQATELPANLAVLATRLRRSGLDMPAPLALDVMADDWPDVHFDAVFTANTLHIMPWNHTPVFLRRASTCLSNGGQVLIYGPFHYGGEHTSDSNRAFSDMLSARDPSMGLRDAIEVARIARSHDLEKRGDIEMPANNRVLVFEKG